MPSHRDAPLSQSKRETFRQQVLTDHGPICKMPRCLMSSRRIDLALVFPHPGSYTADHIQQVFADGDPYDRRNGRPAHLRCNCSAGSRAGNRARKGKPRRRVILLKTSKAW